MPPSYFKRESTTTTAASGGGGGAASSSSSTRRRSRRGSGGGGAPPRHYSENSTASIPDSCFWTQDFVLGASMVVIQPSSGKVVIVNNTARRTWFLPRGRKDIGESLEQCALREAYEEVRALSLCPPRSACPPALPSLPLRP